MRIPWILYADMASSGAPLAAAIIARRGFSTPARRLMVAWSALLLASNLLALLLAHQGQNNHWLSYIVTPIAGMLALWALSLWQTSPVVMLSLRLLVPLLAITWIGMVLFVENTQTFSL